MTVTSSWGMSAKRLSLLCLFPSYVRVRIVVSLLSRSSEENVLGENNREKGIG